MKGVVSIRKSPCLMMTLIQLDKARPRTANVPSANQQESLYIPPLPCGRWTLNRKHSEY